MRIVEVLIERTVQSLNRPFYYLYDKEKKIEIGYRVLVTFNKQSLVGYVINVIETTKSKEQLTLEYGFDLLYVNDVIDEMPLLNEELMKLSDELSDFYLSPKISILQTMLPTSLKPAKSSFNGPKIAYEKKISAISEDEEGLTPKQIEILRLIINNGSVLMQEAKKFCSQGVIDKLFEKQKIQIIEVEKSRYKMPDYVMSKPPRLTKDQNAAIESILHTDKEVTLLEGVTGSGKTEIYLSLCEEMIKVNKNIIFLVPEISLTPIMVESFLRRFKNKVAILHSELTNAEKYDEYRKISKGESNIVVGARSAIFAPLKNIGLIILDEEHVESFKQDSLPCYHAREVAILRAKHFNAKVVLGSATPLLESKARAKKGVYNYVYLPNRINQKSLPETTIVNMLMPSNLTRVSSILSTLLINKIQSTLNKKEQVVLLINRRGFSTQLVCRNCGHVFTCPDCGVSLTYHKEDNMLKCHHCGHVELNPISCPKCSSSHLSRIGFGTEKVEEEVKRIFLGVKTLRLDSDVSKVRNNIATTLEKFRLHQADILIGTQMIAKGHDFPNVTLVGIVLADIGLTSPSFRSSERAFELITQAVGRSGRGDKVGEAIIQTYSPNHYAIVLAAKQDFEMFYSKEMQVRKIEQYPPYTFLISLEISSKNERLCEDTINYIASDIVSKNFEGVKVLGPASPYISFELGTFKRIILIKYKIEYEIKPYLSLLLIALQKKSQIGVLVNVDPFDV